MGIERGTKAQLGRLALRGAATPAQPLEGGAHHDMAGRSMPPLLQTRQAVRGTGWVGGSPRRS
jgi:hypothetical protein